jgi:16S rRNA (guanine966-N2)-methyltransferase
MRIIGGKHRGRKLNSPASDHIRPTTDRMRETLFNILSHGTGSGFKGAKILDIFAGTGALGLESLSRGAKEVTFIEKDKRSLRIISQNIADLREEGTTTIKSINAKKITDEIGSFNYIFMDPPYNMGFISPLLKTIERFSLLDQNGIIVLECDSNEDVVIPNFLFIVKEKKYGNSKILILKSNP